MNSMVFHYGYKVPFEDIIENAWGSRAERIAVDNAAALIPPEQLKSITVAFHDRFLLEHASLPTNTSGPLIWDFTFEIEQPAGPVCLWPRSWATKVQEVMPMPLRMVCLDIIRDKLDQYAVRYALNTLQTRCDTHEQALFLMPYWANILHMAGFSDLAKIEVTRMPPNMPTLSEQQRRAIRAANTIIAGHVLLGTLDGTFNHQRRDTTNCTVTLAGNQTVDFETEAGIEWEVALRG